MTSRTNRKSSGSRGGGARGVASGTLIASIIAAFVLGYVLSALVGGFPAVGGNPGGPSRGSAGALIEPPATNSEYIQALRRKADQNPENREVWTELGNAYFDSDRYGEAVDAYRRSLDIDPGNADVWTDLGIMYRRLGQYDQALKSFDRAIAEEPSHQMSRFNKGIVLYYDLGDRVGAFASWDELARINPGFRTPNGRTIVQMIGELR
jgi:cytochrome c-type biogenesis protein CcmH/NrfG